MSHPLYSLAVTYLRRASRPELRATFTRDWYMHGQEEAVLRLAVRRMFEVADYEDH